MAALDLGQNWLTGALNGTLASLSNAANIGLALYDNLLSSTIPASYSAFSWIAVAYNPALYGAFPAGLVTSTQNKLQAWSTYGTAGFYSYAWGANPASSGTIASTYLQAPTYSTGLLFGTSIGLDRPLATILLDLKAALDPGGTVLRSWNSSTMQFCPPYQTYSTPGQRSTQPGYGRWLPGLFQPSSYGATTGTSYCNDYGITPSKPFVYSYTSPPTIQQLANPLGSATDYTSTIPQTAATVGGISALCLNGLGLSGTLPVQLRELRTTTNILMSRNALAGALPAAWGTAVAWNASLPASSKGFDSTVMLDLSQNRLNSTLPSVLGYLGKYIGLALFDNLFNGSIPSSYSSLNWVAVAYNPGLVGVLPAGLSATGKLFAWSSYMYDFYSYSYATAAGGRYPYGYPPCKENGGYGTGWLYGTSVGLDRPLVNILLDIKAALDPTNSVLTSWNASQLQPCRPFSYNGGSNAAQSASSPGYGQSWKYISTANVLNSGEYCQDLQAISITVATSPSASVQNMQLSGGIAALYLNGVSLKGTLPATLQELRTASAVNLARNQLSGSIPSVWCVHMPCALVCLTDRGTTAQGHILDLEKFCHIAGLHVASLDWQQPGRCRARPGAERAQRHAQLCTLAAHQCAHHWRFCV